MGRYSLCLTRSVKSSRRPMANHSSPLLDDDSPDTPSFAVHIPARLVGLTILVLVLLILAALASWSIDDPSLSYATDKAPANWLGFWGAVIADLGFQLLGLAALVALIPPAFWGWSLFRRQVPARFGLRLITWIGGSVLAAGFMSCIAVPTSWPLPTGLGGLAGNGFSALAGFVIGHTPAGAESILYSLILLPPALALFWLAAGTGSHAPAPISENIDDEKRYRTSIFDVTIGGLAHTAYSIRTAWRRAWMESRTRRQESDAEWERATRDFKYQAPEPVEPPLEALPSHDHYASAERQEPHLALPEDDFYPPVEDDSDYADADYYDETAYAPEPDYAPAPVQQASNRVAQPKTDDNRARMSVEHGPGPAANNPQRVVAPAARPKPGTRLAQEAQGSLLETEGFELPELNLLAEPKHKGLAPEHRPEKLEENARRLEGVLADFGVKGDIINVRPGPVVTLYELEPAPGIKSSRVISLADDIARSMSAISARVAVVPGRNAIGIELPNKSRETVYLREMLASADFEKMKGKLNICLGKTIGGEPVIADLARMPHLLVAGTTGSGKSVAINTMILSLLYRMTPEQCRLIMIDPKMLELSVYDGIPHLLSPVVTDPSKAVVALKWAVREMEDRYRKMSKIGVRNIDGFNQRVSEANDKGKVISRTVQTGFNKDTGEAIFESEEFELEPLPYIVIIIDEMADLMMVAGKDIEGAVQRLAQMARAAGIHVVMATQRPSVDVITGTIKANFPTRISFQVTSKIDSRTILGEQGAEQLLGMGDMLYMAGGGRIRRLHGPFCADSEVEDVVSHLKMQGSPDYLESITVEEDEETMGGFDNAGEFGGSGDELYDKAVNIVLQDKKASTSYIQRRLSIGYNRAATLIEKMEQEGVISPANHAGKREILVGDGVDY